MSRIMINGIAGDYVHAMDRGLAYGDGLFETLVCVDGKLQFWQQHMARMQSAADTLGIECPDTTRFFSDITTLYKSQSLKRDYIVKIILTRGSGERGYAYAADQRPTRIVMLFDLDPETAPARDINVCVCKHRLPVSPALAGIKHLNRLDNVLARREWQQQYFEGLMLDSDDNVIEGTMSNLFAVSNNELYTPDLEQCGVHGIIRDQIIDIAHEHGIKLSITSLSLQAIEQMDALFLCNSVIQIVPVTFLREKRFSDNTVTQFISQQLEQRIKKHAQALS